MNTENAKALPLTGFLLVAAFGGANAGTLTGGTFELTYDSPANLLNGLTVGPGAITEWHVAGFFPKSTADTATVSAMVGTPDFATPATLSFDVNPGDLTGTGIPTGGALGGRNNQATTLSWNASQDSLTNSSTFGATGQVGLNGVISTRGSFTGTLLYGDFDFQYKAARDNGTNSGWTLTNHVSFASTSYDTRNLNVTTDGDNLVMTGELWLSPNTGAFLLGTNGVINPGRMGTFVLTSPVPVPAAVWLFGSALVGLTGVARRRHLAAA